MLEDKEFYYLPCDCLDPSHFLRVTYWKEDQDFAFEVVLNETPPFWKRIWFALKYIIGREVPYFYFNSIHRDNVEDLIKFLEKNSNEKTESSKSKSAV